MKVGESRHFVEESFKWRFGGGRALPRRSVATRAHSFTRRNGPGRFSTRWPLQSLIRPYAKWGSQTFLYARAMGGSRYCSKRRFSASARRAAERIESCRHAARAIRDRAMRPGGRTPRDMVSRAYACDVGNSRAAASAFHQFPHNSATFSDGLPSAFVGAFQCACRAGQ